MKEVKWELDLRSHNKIKIFVSGGIKEKAILKFNQIADAYGAGTAISNAPVVDFSMDIEEVADQPVAKRGKQSGRNSVTRCPDCFKKSIACRKLF